MCTPIRPAGAEDSVVIALDADGASRSAHTYGSVAQDATRDVAWMGTDRGVVVGLLGGSLEIAAGRTIMAAGGVDGFVIGFPR